MMVSTKGNLPVKNFGKFHNQDILAPHTYRGDVEVSKGTWVDAEWTQDGKCINHKGDEYFIGNTKHIPVTREQMYKFSHDEKLEHAFFFVNGDHYDAWEKYHKEVDVKWIQDSSGFSQHVGFLYRKNGRKYEEMPVRISFQFALINDVYVCFYTSDSMVTDWKMIEDLVEQYAGQYDSASRRAMTNNMNFHHCLQYCQKPH